jgi:membrane protein DedA with SNARE-associated domain
MDFLVLALSLALATLVSEDLACVAAGAAVAEGMIGFAPATMACFAGILGGDLLLFALGRVFGRCVLAWPAVARRLAPHAIERSSDWIARRGALVVLLSRFTPGTRLPTYLAAGILRTDARCFVLWFTLAAALWTPVLVGLSAIVGGEVVAADIVAGRGAVVRLLVAVVAMALVLRLLYALRSATVRRRLVGRWRRVTRWEFWPMWLVYPPVVLYVLRLMVRYRSATLFTAANPAIPGGGFVGESKFDILRSLSGSADRVARAALLPADATAEQRQRSARHFIEHHALGFPIVLKPDRGQRGSGVTIVRSLPGLMERIAAATTDQILQEYAPGLEFGVFYYRHPRQARGRIFSLTEKRFPHVIGDGRRTLEELILADDRAVCMERLHCTVHRGRLDDVPALGERVPLVEIGSHCRGSLFLDAGHLVTPALEAAFDEIARRFDRFHFGRFDVRTPSIDDLRAGRRFTIVELNGVTSEPTHIYDPANGLFSAWRTLCTQWRFAFAIGAANVRRGATPTPLASLLSMAAARTRAGVRRPRVKSRGLGGSVQRPTVPSNEVGVRI